ncbi:MAG: DNA-3-methyladenine glycosylase family protein [Acidimicrobiales bacterium]
MKRRSFILEFEPDLASTLAPLRLGRYDPTTTIGLGGVWRASRTPDGPATVHLHVRSEQRCTVDASAWGPGAEWVLDNAPGWVGALDDTTDFTPSGHPVLERAARERPGYRVLRTERVLEILVPTILSQKVTTLEATRSWSALVRRAAEPAPGPAGLLLPPDPAWLARLPDHAFHLANVERRRASTIRAAARHAPRLEEGAGLGRDVLRARLGAIAGIGPWTIAEVMFVAIGDADALSVGDYHLPNTVSWALAREPRGNDARMLELLAPFFPHRGRAARLLEASGRAPRFGPRLAPRTIAHL